MENDKYQLLQDWHELLKAGAITEDEFNRKKVELIGGIKDQTKNVVSSAEVFNDEYCIMQSLNGTDMVGFRISNWQPGEIKKFNIKIPPFGSESNFCYSSFDFDDTPKEIFIELYASATSTEFDPEGAFARYNLLDLCRSYSVKICLFLLFICNKNCIFSLFVVYMQ